MRIETTVDVGEQYVYVDVSKEDIAEAIIEEGDGDGVIFVLQTMNNIALYVNSIPDEIVAEMNAMQKTTITKYFRNMITRFEETIKT